MDIEVLRRAPLFASLGDDVFAALTDELIEVDLPRGSSVFREGDQGDQLYFIVSGKIKLGRTAADGRENLVAILGPGELFGEAVLEIGPGPGGLTRALLRAGARVTAIEMDRRCLPALAELSEAFPGQLRVIQGDALKLDHDALMEGEPYAVLSNLP